VRRALQRAGVFERLTRGGPRFALGSLALGALALCLPEAGCGRTGGLSPSPGGGPASGVAGGAASGASAFDRRFDVVDAFAEECWSACGGKQPSSTFACLTPPIEVCSDACALVLRNVERACAECITATLSWPQGQHYCNDFECTCDPLSGGPQFTDCPEKCAASRAYQLHLRESAPRPDDLGGPPPERLVVSGPPLHAIAAAPDALFALQHDPPELALLSLDGASQWSASLSGGSASTLVSNGSSALLRVGASAPRWLVFDAGGQSHQLGSNDLLQPGASLPDGFVAKVRGELQRFSDRGALVSSAALPGELSPVTQLVELRQGGYAVSAQPSSSQPSILAHVLDDDAGAALSIAWQLEIGATVTSLAEAADGALFFAALAEPRMYRCCTSERELLLGLVSARGELLWTWQPDSLEARARAPQVFAGGEGLYAVATEDPASSFENGQRRFTPSPQEPYRYAGLCTVYGCSGVAVRRFDARGSLVGEYQLRSQTSVVQGAALVGHELLVLATLHDEEEAQQVLLRVAP
jgi:hypothetical protein